MNKLNKIKDNREINIIRINKIKYKQIEII